ncbi:SSI family serine proteinase inhibitor [Bounagaea algeriensis]
MNSFRRAVFGSVAAAGLALSPVVLSSPALASNPGAASNPDAASNPGAASAVRSEPAAEPAGSMLTLTVQQQNSARSAAVLTCDPAGGSHPAAEQACAALANANGKLDTLKNDDMRCTMEYAPVTATATGDWRGEPVRFQQEYSNSCQLQAETGQVFQL